MQNLINYIIQEEKKKWDSYIFACSHFGYDSREALAFQSKWHQCKELIEMFNLTPPKRNLSKFKHKKYTVIKTCEL
jgi:hypothetical protein